MRRLALAALALVLAGCAGDRPLPARPAAGAPLTSVEHRFTARLPAGWQPAERSLTPHLTDPVEILSAGTLAGMRPRDGACAHVAVGALERMGPRDAFVTVQERFGDARFAARPARFALPPRLEQGDAVACARKAPDLDEHWFEFGDAGRNFYVLAAFGRDAAPERRAEALALLDSLRFEPAEALAYP